MRGAKRDDIVSDLFMALLAVNSWTLEQVGRLYAASKRMTSLTRRP